MAKKVLSLKTRKDPSSSVAQGLRATNLQFSGYNFQAIHCIQQEKKSNKKRSKHTQSNVRFLMCWLLFRSVLICRLDDGPIECNKQLWAKNKYGIWQPKKTIIFFVRKLKETEENPLQWQKALTLKKIALSSALLMVMIILNLDRVAIVRGSWTRAGWQFSRIA